MRPKTMSCLADMRLAAERIVELTSKTTLEEFRSDWQKSAAIERQFEVLGEALVRIRDLEPPAFERVPQGTRIIEMRNFISHGYDAVEPALLWDTAERDVPGLILWIDATLPSHADR